MLKTDAFPSASTRSDLEQFDLNIQHPPPFVY